MNLFINKIWSRRYTWYTITIELKYMKNKLNRVYNSIIRST